MGVSLTAKRAACSVKRLFANVSFARQASVCTAHLHCPDGQEKRKKNPVSQHAPPSVHNSVSLQDVTSKELIRQRPNCDRTVVLYGYLRGCNLRHGQRVHLAGVGDFDVDSAEQLVDPCPLPETLKQRGLNEQVPLFAVSGHAALVASATWLFFSFL